eukprot:TRINITY_DN3800_c0_g1_i3.p1 TRINITY_DN3800_c0_g1~~TRINITY_DN3800_c0_g1_i3.p1  ORF type:complete len:315 (-),score=36.67 TRINITY_DN3800_c0_g1_i3:47-991(-)
MKRYKLILAYNGTNYIGWQKQREVSGAKRSIQSVLTNAFYKAFDFKSVQLSGSSRTDSGVHAMQYVAHVDLEKKEQKDNVPYNASLLMKSVNSTLMKDNEDILITNAEMVPFSFHSRYSATYRRYVYRIISDPELGFNNIWEKNFAWTQESILNLSLMQQGCKLFEGTHNFSNFCRSISRHRDPIRTINFMKAYEVPPPFYSLNRKNTQYIHVEVQGPTFLHSQVRKMVHLIKRIGEGKLLVDDVEKLLTTTDYHTAGYAAPASGLYLMEVGYENQKIDTENNNAPLSNNESSNKAEDNNLIDKILPFSIKEKT